VHCEAGMQPRSVDGPSTLDYLVDFYSKSNRLSISIFTVIVIDIVTMPYRWIMSLELDGGKHVLAMTGEITKLVS
jgi:hypothetical protein